MKIGNKEELPILSAIVIVGLSPFSAIRKRMDSRWRVGGLASRLNGMLQKSIFSKGKCAWTAEMLRESIIFRTDTAFCRYRDENDGSLQQFGA